MKPNQKKGAPKIKWETAGFCYDAARDGAMVQRAMAKAGGQRMSFSAYLLKLIELDLRGKNGNCSDQNL